MPYVNVQITREGATDDQKAEVIRRITDTLVQVLGKEPATTFVVIEEIEPANWGGGGLPVDEFRRRRRHTPG